MKRTLITWMAAAAVTLAAVSASAAIVTLSGPSSVQQGATIFLVSTASTGVGPADVANVASGGNITYQDAFVNTNIPSNMQTLIPGLATLGALDCTATRCRAWNQIGVPGDPAFVPAVSGFELSRTSFIIDPTAPIGTVLTFNWQTNPVTQALNFFGAVPGAGVTMTVVVPEPTTAAMIGLGLFGLALAGRRRA